MTLFDIQPLPKLSTAVTLRDKKGRAWRRRPYWIDLGKGPEGRTCKTCQYLVRYERAKVYFKCGTWKVTGGPGTGIASTDPACSRYQRKGLEMIRIKPDLDMTGIRR